MLSLLKKIGFMVSLLFMAMTANAATTYQMTIPAPGVSAPKPAGSPAPVAAASMTVGPVQSLWAKIACDGGITCTHGWSMAGIAWDTSQPYYGLSAGYGSNYYITLSYPSLTHFTRVIASTYGTNGYTYNAQLLIYTTNDPASGNWTLVQTIDMPQGAGVDQSIGPFDAQYVRIQGGTGNYYGGNTSFGIQLLSQ